MEQQLIDASKNGEIKMVRRLLDAKTDVHVNNDQPLRYAAGYGYTEIVRMLLDAGANVHADDDDSLRIAAYRGYTEIVRMLLAAGADVHVDDDYAFKEAARKGNMPMVEMLLDARRVNANYNGVLRWAAMFGCPEIIRMLLDADANTHDGNDAPLQNAAARGYIEIVRMLLDAGRADPTKFDGIFMSYMTISDETKQTILELLEKYQPDDPDLIVDKLGTTNLMIVAQNGPTYKLREYLTRSRVIDKQDKDGNTALLYAVDSNDPMRVQLLFEKGANPLLKNKKGHTAWDYAEAKNNPKILAILLPTVRVMQRGVPLDVRQMVGQYTK